MHVARDGSRPPRLGTLVGAIAVLGAGALVLAVRLGVPLPPCRLREVTGVPCPACGSTRLLEELAAGDVPAAAAANPTVFVALLAVLAWAALATVGRRLVLERREKRGLGVLAVIGAAAGWAYAVWGGSGGGGGG